MFKIGCHLSSSGGFLATAQTAKSIDANVFQVFSRNPRGGNAKPFDPNDATAYADYCAANAIGPMLFHAPYTLNAAGAEQRVRDFAQLAMAEDFAKLKLFPGALYNFHPGSHVGQGIEQGIILIADCINRILKPEHNIVVLLETMAGKGSEVGSTFEELAEIISRIELKEKMGVCLDTCHVWDAGYDIVNDLDGVLAHFDKVIGLKRLHAIHTNDSMNARSSHKDRHACIGKGHIGLDAFQRIINHPLLRDLPFYLETPCDLDGYRAEISLLRSLRS